MEKRRRKRIPVKPNLNTMNKQQLLQAAKQYSEDVKKWVKDVEQWAETDSEGGPGSNPPPPPPPPTGFENP